jgi:DNA-binding XRE family transcriptional regulator/DNA-binding transcriptional ArsR family regulator
MLTPTRNRQKGVQSVTMLGGEPIEGSDFGALLRRLRIAAGLTQEGVAAGAGLSVRSLREIERGAVRYPRPDSARRLAVALGLGGMQRTRFELLARAGYWSDRSRPRAPVEKNRCPNCAGPGPGPAQLPAVISDHVDRVEHLTALDAMLTGDRAGAVTVVVITGAGGTGKTALAARWARSIAHRFPGGQLHVDLLGFADDPPLPPGRALRRFLSALGTPADCIPADVSEATGLYRSLVADRPVLVLLDNAASAEQVMPLLPGGPGSLVIVTSRSLLDGLVVRYGAGRLVVGELRPDEAMTLLDGVVGAERVGSERDAAARLVASCGHLALAVRIAATRLLARPAGSIAGYAAEFVAGNPLDALECDDAALRRTFLHSYRRLDADTARVFRRAGLVDGPSFTASAAAAVSGLSYRAVSSALARLTAGHLVEAVDGDRFRFHDLLRRYARERCDAEESVPADARCHA